MQQSKISIITPSFNSGSYLAECIKSVQEQGDIIEKHIIIDGGSTDGTIEILNNYKNQFPNIFFITEKDQGQADALNKALKYVETEYFGWLNADDRYIPNKLNSLLVALRELKNTNIAIIYGDYRLIDDKGNITDIRHQPSFSYFDCLYSYLTIHNGAALFNKTNAIQNDGFDTTLKFAMDYDLILKLSKNFKVLHINEFVSDFRIHPSSKTTNLEKIRKAETDLIREKYSKHKKLIIYLFNKVSILRVIYRMFKEGILQERIKRYIK